MNVGDDSTASDSGLDESVELLIASDRELQVSGSYSLHLKVFWGISSQLEDLSGQVLEDSSCVDSWSSADSAVGADSALQESVNSSNWELY